MSDLITKQNDELEHDEKVRPVLPGELPLPVEIAHLDESELKVLEKGLTRRLDMTLMPTVFLLFLLNILWVFRTKRWTVLTIEIGRDRNNIASAKIVGLQDDLGMTNNQYNTCLMMFYVGCMLILSHRDIANGLKTSSLSFLRI